MTSQTLKDLFDTPFYTLIVRSPRHAAIPVCRTQDPSEMKAKVSHYDQQYRKADILVRVGKGELGQQRELTPWEVDKLFRTSDEDDSNEHLTAFDEIFKSCIQEVFDEEQLEELDGELARLKEMLLEKLDHATQ